MTAADPMDALIEHTRRTDQEAKVLKKIENARKRLIFGRTPDEAFWATLIFRLPTELSWEVETAATNGSKILYNPDYVETLTDAELLGLIVHETAHCAFDYFSRVGARDPQMANVAHDLAINPLITKGTFKLPKGALFPRQGPFGFVPEDLSFEAIYSLLQQKEGEKQDQGGDGKGQGKGKAKSDPGGCGTVEKPGDGSQAAISEAKANWEVDVAKAAQIAKQRGSLSAGLDQFVQDVLAPRFSPEESLREFVSKRAKVESRWTPPNRRFISRGLYLPGRSGETVGNIILAVDASGSTHEHLPKFAGWMQAVIECYPDSELTILFHDSDITGVERWAPGDGDLELNFPGGGGTSHKCVFEWIEEQDEQPECVVLLTDMDSSFPTNAPIFPCLWVCTNKQVGPWGQTIYLGE